LLSVVGLFLRALSDKGRLLKLRIVLVVVLFFALALALGIVSTCHLRHRVLGENRTQKAPEPLTADRLDTDRQAFEKAADYAQRITDSVLLILGGSIVILLGNSYRRPAGRWMRATYLIFPLGWAVLWGSVDAGMQIRGTYIAYMLRPPKDSAERFSQITKLNTYAIRQMDRLYVGLVIFGIWLMIYLLWWIFFAPMEEAKGDGLR
jgi:hypothetical protein